MNSSSNPNVSSHNLQGHHLSGLGRMNLGPPDLDLLDEDSARSEPTFFPSKLSNNDDDPSSPLTTPTSTWRKFFGAVFTFLILVGLSYAIPSLEFAQPWRSDESYIPFWNLIGREFLGQGAEIKEAQLALTDLEEHLVEDESLDDLVLLDEIESESNVSPPIPTFPAYTPKPKDPTTIETPIEFPENLETFMLALTQTELRQPGAITRVSHWGDSVLGNDGITAAVRQAFQARFGDSGHGFHSLAQYNPSYQHKGIEFKERGRWKFCYIINRCKRDGHYGYGGATAWSSGGSESRFSTTKKGAFGRKVSRMELWYAAQPRGGKLRVTIDNQAPTVIDTREESLTDRWKEFEVADGPHTISIRAVGRGTARAYGVVFERNRPGVVWDGMALIGSFTSRMSYHNSDHLRRQIAHRRPDMMVFTFGGNDMTREKSDLARSMEKHKKEYRKVIQMARAGKPNASCLIMAPIDHGERKQGRVVTRKIVFRMVEAQRELAEELKCGFFDTFRAMGGEGSIGKWFHRKPRLASGDLSHPTHRGHKVIGQSLLYRSLMFAYLQYRKKMEGQPLATKSPSTSLSNQNPRSP